MKISKIFDYLFILFLDGNNIDNNNKLQKYIQQESIRKSLTQIKHVRVFQKNDK